MLNVQGVVDKESKLAAHPVLYVVILFVFFLGIQVVVSSVGALSFLLLDIPFSNLSNIISYVEDKPEIKSILLILQGATSLFSFLGAPWVMNKLFPALPSTKFFKFKSVDIRIVILSILSVVALYPFIIRLEGYNKNVVFPEFLKGLEQVFRNMEDRAMEMLEVMTDLTTVPEILLGFLVVAIIAAVTEEYFFRGFLQHYFIKIGVNIHTSIWITAILFSAMHMQFYGFFPRIVLGVLFGYFYYFSGNLWVPIFAHFLNNGFSLAIILYLKSYRPDVNINDTPEIPYMMFIFSLISGIGLLYLLKQYSSKVKEDHLKNEIK